MQLNRKWKKAVLVINDIVSKTETTPETVFEEVEGQALLGRVGDACGLAGGLGTLPGLAVVMTVTGCLRTAQALAEHLPPCYPTHSLKLLAQVSQVE